MLLDTNVLIHATRISDPVYAAVRAFLDQENAPYVSALSRVEFLGWDAGTPEDIALRVAIYEVLTELPMDTPVLDVAAQLRRQRRGVKTADAIIAATALYYGLPIVTCNVRHFAWIERLDVIDPSVES